MMNFMVFVEERFMEQQMKSEENEIFNDHHEKDLGKNPTQTRS